MHEESREELFAKLEGKYSKAAISEAYETSEEDVKKDCFG